VLTSTDYPLAFPCPRLQARGPAWRRSFLRWVCFAALAAVLSQSVAAEPTKEIRRILILNEAGISYPAIKIINEGILTTLQNSPYRLEFYSESLDTLLFPDPASQKEFRDFYIHKYRNRRPDVIITIGSGPLNFMREAHQTAFPGVPIVFCLPSQAVPSSPTLDSDFTGVENGIASAETLAIALRLRPGTQHVVVVGGASDYDKQLVAAIKQQIRDFNDGIDITYLTDLAMPDLLDRLRHLPDHTIVLLTTVARDAAGISFKSSESGPLVAGASNAPVFSLFDLFLNHGEVGGDLSSFSAQARVAASMVLRILNGEKAQDIPRAGNVTNFMFDWRAVKRWGLKEAALPPGSIVLNRRPGFWELYKEYVLAGILIFLAQATAILGLLWQRARRRKTEDALRRSEQKFSKSFRQSPLAISITSTNGDRYLEINETFEELTGWRRDEVAGRSHSEIKLWLDREHRSAFLKQLLAQGSLRDLEIRIRRKDGQIRTTLGSAELIEVDGEKCCLYVSTDITERKQAEDALASVSHKLIEAQEKERTRIARDLHDDINQQIALAAVELEGLQSSISNLESEAGRRMKAVLKRISDIGMEVQAISHRLHSSKLEILGVVSACRSFCREVAERHKVTVDFAADGVPHAVPQDVSLCVFRILQESLNNAIKYSGTDHFEVRLIAVSDEIQLTVRDCGVGFDAPAALNGHGLGLVSMRERASLVKGTLSITSEPMAGTEITLRVPIAVSRQSQAISGAA
jgi:PAS domain S-box-containing protein